MPFLAVPVKLPRITSKVMLGIFLFTAVWFALVLTSPLMVPANTLRDLTGVVGQHDNDAQFNGLSALPHAIYWIGDAECHQIATRSFFINGNEMPFCSRDTGLFFGLAFGLGIATFVRYKIKPWLALAGLVPLALDGGMQLLTNYESNNPMRLATGIVAGIACGLLLAHFIFALQEDKPKPKPTPTTPEGEKSPSGG